VQFESDHRGDALLFSEAPGRAVISVDKARLTSVLEAALQHGVEARAIGEVKGDRLVFKTGERELINFDLQEAAALWEGSIRCFMS